MRWTATLLLKTAYTLLSVAIATAQQISKSQEEFDFFWFVLQWPGRRSFDRNPCCYPPDGKPMADFVIHDLWPQRLDGTRPEYCTSEEFDGSQVESIRPDLNKLWPSLMCPVTGSTAQYPTFWEHEWQKHGTCSTMTQIEYFKGALNLWNALHEADFLTTLHDYGALHITFD